MILNKLQSLSCPRLLHVALSLLCVLVLLLGLASGALAVSGDYTADQFITLSLYRSNGSLSPLTDGQYVYPVNVVTTSYYNSYFACVVVLPAPCLSGSLDSYFIFPQFSSLSHLISFYDSNGQYLDMFIDESGDMPAGTRFISFYVGSVTLSSNDINSGTVIVPSQVSFSGLVFDGSSSSGSDPSEIDLSEVIDGLDAIAQSLYDLEIGPYSGVSGVTVDSNGDLQHTVVSTASLEDLLNALGIAGTDTNHVLRGIYNNFGSYFTLYSIVDTTSGTTQVFRGLPQYVNALGQTVTDGINRLQRDHVLLYQQTEDIASDLDDALYADTDTSPSLSWSVSEWLKGIYNSLTSFVSSFWSPAETALKEAAEEGMQEAADREIAGSADQVCDMDDLGSGFSSFGDTGNVGAGDLLNSLTGGDYSFFSSTTQQNLAYQPSQQNRGFRSAPSDQVEYVDELSRNREALREVLGLP